MTFTKKNKILAGRVGSWIVSGMQLWHTHASQKAALPLEWQRARSSAWAEEGLPVHSQFTTENSRRQSAT